MAPDKTNDETNDRRDDIDNEGKTPRDGDVGGGPEEPGLDVVLDIPALVGGIGLVPVEVDDERWGNDEAGEDSRADEGGE